jgi:antitoxin ParD1/3/4
MSKAVSIHLDDDSGAFVDRQIATGHFHSADEVIEAGLKLLRDQDRALEEIRNALIEGEESGIAEDFDSETFLKEMRARRLIRIEFGSLRRTLGEIWN